MNWRVSVPSADLAMAERRQSTTIQQTGRKWGALPKCVRPALIRPHQDRAFNLAQQPRTRLATSSTSFTTSLNFRSFVFASFGFAETSVRLCLFARYWWRGESACGVYQGSARCLFCGAIWSAGSHPGTGDRGLSRRGNDGRRGNSWTPRGALRKPSGVENTPVTAAF